MSHDHGQFLQEYSKSLPRIRAFLRQLLPDWHGVDEVLQETSLVLWNKFEKFESGTNFTAWACVIARFEALKYRRKKSRDRLVFEPELMEILAQEYLGQEEKMEEQRLQLQHCLTQLEEKQRLLTLASYSADKTIKDLAEEEGRSPTAMYQALDRIRQRLMKCVKNSPIQEGQA